MQTQDIQHSHQWLCLPEILRSELENNAQLLEEGLLKKCIFINDISNIIPAKIPVRLFNHYYIDKSGNFHRIRFNAKNFRSDIIRVMPPQSLESWARKWIDRFRNNKIYSNINPWAPAKDAKENSSRSSPQQANVYHETSSTISATRLQQALLDLSSIAERMAHAMSVIKNNLHINNRNERNFIQLVRFVDEKCIAAPKAISVQYLKNNIIFTNEKKILEKCHHELIDVLHIFLRGCQEILEFGDENQSLQNMLASSANQDRYRDALLSIGFLEKDVRKILSEVKSQLLPQ